MPYAEDAKPVRVGLIGLGFMGMVHLKSYRKLPGVRVAALCSTNTRPVDGVLRGVGGNITDGDAMQIDEDCKFYQNWEDLIADDEIDLVDICVPTSHHVRMSLAALAAGKHVICEKPMARTRAECQQIVDAAAKSKGYFMPAMCIRFWPGWDWLKEAIDSNSYGPVLAARFRRASCPPGWSRGNYFNGSESGGALFDLHIHDTDFIQHCFGRPLSVTSRGCTRFSGAIDHVVTSYEVASGAVVSAEGSWIMHDGYPFVMAYTVNFERATTDFDLSRGAEALKLYIDGEAPQSIALRDEDGYVGELRHLIDSIRNGWPPSVVTASDGMSAVEICEAEEASAQNKTTVRLDPAATA